MESLVLEVEKRDAAGKGAARRERAKGRLPGVFYGAQSSTTAVALDVLAFDRRIRGLEGTHLIELKSSDSSLDGRKVVIRELQENPVTGASVHVDLFEVPLDKPIEVSVPLHFLGKAEGVTLGGILQPILRELAVMCLPTQIPESIDVDVSGLGIHDTLHVSALTLPEGATLVDDTDPPVVTVVPPTAEKTPEEAAAAAAEGATPEGATEGEAAPTPEASKS